MCSIIGVFTIGARGFGTSPVSGESRFPLPAASTTALIEVRPSPAAETPHINYILSDAHGNTTSALSLGQARRTPEAVHGLEDRWPRRRAPGAFERGRAHRGRRDRPRA